MGTCCACSGRVRRRRLIAVDLLVKLEEPLAIVQPYVGGVCDADNKLILPLEVTLVMDPATVVPLQQVPTVELLRTFIDWPDLLAKLPGSPEFRVTCRTVITPTRVGPMLYCRKRHAVFLAHSPTTGQPLKAVPTEPDDRKTIPVGDALPIELCSWDGPAEGDRAVALYGGEGGKVRLGEVASLEQLILDQRKVIERHDQLNGSRSGDGGAAFGAALVYALPGSRTVLSRGRRLRVRRRPAGCR